MFVESVSHELGALNPPVVVKLIVVHGAVEGTNFGQSSNSTPILGYWTAEEDDRGKPEKAKMQQRYGEYTARVFKAYANITAGGMPTEAPAKKIFEAATDGTKKLRYFIGGSEKGAPLMVRMDGMKEGEDLDAADDRYFQWMVRRFV